MCEVDVDKELVFQSAADHSQGQQYHEAHCLFHFSFIACLLLHDAIPLPFYSRLCEAPFAYPIAAPYSGGGVLQIRSGL